MNPFTVSGIAFSCMLGGVLVGMRLGTTLPDHHLETSSKDVVRLAMAMITTMTALVLGLVTASAKSAFDTEDAAIKQTSATVLEVDRMLADYGPETKPIREEIRQTIATKLAEFWPEDSSHGVVNAPSNSPAGETLVGRILALTPATEAQHWQKERALALSAEILQARWIVFGGAQSSVPTMFLVVIICWLTVLFGSFGLFAPRNATVIGSLLICCLSVAASIFLILEMTDPFQGVMKISSAPMRYAIAHVGQ